MMEETSLRNRRGLRVPACIGILKRNTPLSSPSGWRDISATASDRTRDSDHGPGPWLFHFKVGPPCPGAGPSRRGPGPRAARPRHARGTRSQRALGLGGPSCSGAWPAFAVRRSFKSSLSGQSHPDSDGRPRISAASWSLAIGIRAALSAKCCGERGEGDPALTGTTC